MLRPTGAWPSTTLPMRPPADAGRVRARAPGKAFHATPFHALGTPSGRPEARLRRPIRRTFQEESARSLDPYAPSTPATAMATFRIDGSGGVGVAAGRAEQPRGRPDGRVAGPVRSTSFADTSKRGPDGPISCKRLRDPCWSRSRQSQRQPSDRGASCQLRAHRVLRQHVEREQVAMLSASGA